MSTLLTLVAGGFRMNEKIKGINHEAPKELVFPTREMYSDLEGKAHCFNS